MSGFDPAWLRVREPFDDKARSLALADRFVASLGDAPTVIDLGGGSGANLRHLAPRLGDEQHWIVYDNDPVLLESLISETAQWAEEHGWKFKTAGREDCVVKGEGRRIEVHYEVLDLATNLPDVVFDAATGITGSALLDLASAAWLDELATAIHRNGLPVLFALSFDGRMTWQPPAGDDALIREAFVAHQRTDKGFGGPSLGPEAVGHLAKALRAPGWSVATAMSDWHIAPGDAAMLTAMLDGVGKAALEARPGDLEAIDRWLAGRRADLEAGRLDLAVGHVDLLALPLP
ncbi:class I SAM-dependent methyltransferase [Marinivivus vitaminiproducens]|uniref:class I SAM-dependent methyltransferase n=1 Tax=Marinivivus vitaminiproducens TaxID=3035935 RepID=UPI002798E196|nr:class I SAM-dependent methyltransferase [Geminicoccaceae bacterium SCSIO 64248]